MSGFFINKKIARTRKRKDRRTPAVQRSRRSACACGFLHHFYIIFTSFCVHFWVFLCPFMSFVKNEKSLENTGFISIFKAFLNGGEGEIRTLEPCYRLHDFQSCALDQLGDFSKIATRILYHKHFIKSIPFYNFLNFIFWVAKSYLNMLHHLGNKILTEYRKTEVG